MSNTIFWILTVVDGSILVLLITARISHGKISQKGSIQQSCKIQQSWIEQIIMPAGEWIILIYERWKERIAPVRRKRPTVDRRLFGHVVKEKERSGSIFQLMVELSGKEEGARRYREYLAKRWGSLLLALWLCLSAFLGSEVLARKKDYSLSEIIPRPAYGEGENAVRVTMTVQGQEGSMSDNLLLKIPQQPISQEMAEELLTNSLEKLEETLRGLVIIEKLNLPVKMGEVSLSYRSLTPKVMRASGDILVRPQPSRIPIRLEVTASIGQYQQARMIDMELAALSELTLEERMKLLGEDLKGETYLSESELVLPKVTEEGEIISWTQTKDDNRFLWGLIFLLVPALLMVGQDYEFRQQSEKRLVEIRKTYPEFLGELVILAGSGLSLSGAWKRLAADYRKLNRNDPLMEEVLRASMEMEEGASMREALLHFSDRIPIREIRRFVSLLTQNLRRGDAYLLSRIRELSDEAWENRKKQVKEKSEEADAKLLLPLLLMLCVVLIMVMSPAMISLNY